MKLKPKKSFGGARALLYRRYTNLENSFATNSVYKTNIDGKFWVFDKATLSFLEVVAQSSIAIIYNQTRAKFGNTVWKYTANNGWEVTPDTGTLEIKFSNIGKYQTNKYYFVGSFDYVIKGSINMTEIQPLSGLIEDLKSFQIEYYCDDIFITHDDLVIVGNKLYSVENPTVDMKRQPKPYYIYGATLNSIL